jgi:hypothetical protein
VRDRWASQAQGFVRSLMRYDQGGVLAINAAVRALQAGGEPEGFHRRGYHRLHVGPYRVHCVIEDGVLNVVRIDRVKE